MIDQFLDGLARNAHDLFLLAVLFAGLIGLFIAGMGALRFLEFVFPRFSRWLDTLDSERRGF